MKAKYRTYQQTFDYVTRNSGLNVRRFQDIYQMYFGISTESEYGLALPSWLNSVWPDTIIKLSIEEYFVSMGMFIIYQSNYHRGSISYSFTLLNYIC